MRNEFGEDQPYLPFSEVPMLLAAPLMHIGSYEGSHVEGLVHELPHRWQCSCGWKSQWTQTSAQAYGAWKVRISAPIQTRQHSSPFPTTTRTNEAVLYCAGEGWQVGLEAAIL